MHKLLLPFFCAPKRIKTHATTASVEAFIGKQVREAVRDDPAYHINVADFAA